MDTEQLARAFKALGDPSRLGILDFLRCCPVCEACDEEGKPDETGPTVGDVCCSVFEGPTAASRVSFHLKELREAGLVHVEKRGRCRICRARTDVLDSLAAYLSPAGACCGAAEPDQDSKEV